MLTEISTFLPMILCGVVLVLGAAVAAWGVRGARKGDAPHCVKCDYELTGSASRICPECGTEKTAANVRKGQRQRRYGLIMLGIVIVVASLIAEVRLIGGHSRNGSYPTSSSHFSVAIPICIHACRVGLEPGGCEEDVRLVTQRLQTFFLKLRRYLLRNGQGRVQASSEVIGDIDAALKIVSDMAPLVQKPVASMTQSDREALGDCLNQLQECYDRIRFIMHRDGL